MEWRDNDEECQRNGVSDRGAFERIRFVMNLFKNHFLEQIVYRNDKEDGRSSSSEKSIYVDLFAECLIEYNVVSLLNDFECIRQHRAGTEELRDCKFSGPLSVCCGDLMRECRELEDENVHDMKSSRGRHFKRYLKSLDERQQLLIETTTKIHCFINHSIHRTENELNDDDEKRDGVSMWRRGRRRQIANKFVNEMNTTYPTKRNDDGTLKTKMDDLPSVLASHRNYSVSQPHPSGSSPDSFCEFVKSEDMDSDAIVDDLEDSVYRLKVSRESIKDTMHTISAESNLSPMLDSDSVLVKKVVHHFNQLDVFHFGAPMRNWKRWKQYPGYIESPKYHNLKEECLNNDIHSMSRFQFHCLLVHARTLWQTDKCRHVKSAKIGRDQIDMLIPGHSPLSLSHLFVLLMYCNLTQLQTDYKKHGCREKAGEPFDLSALNALMLRNSEIGWWYKLIFETVMLWGTRVTVNDVFYTGLNKPMLFESMAPGWFCPFSTSVSGIVALNFATMKGVILQMKGSSYSGSRDTYMDCEWFSNYPEECERLFVMSEDLRIVDINTFDFGNKMWTSNRVPISALVLFSAVSQGHWIAKLLGKETDEDSPDTMLLMMIREYNDRSRTNNSLYIEQMFHYLIKRKRLELSQQKPWRMIKSEYLLLSEELRRELVQFDSGGYVRISPFLRSLGCTVDNIHFMEEYMWILTGKELDRFKAMSAGGVMGSKTYSYRGNFGLIIRFRLELQRNMDGSRYTRFSLQVPDHSDNGIEGIYGVSIDEVDWYRNAVTLRKGEMGNFCISSFQDSLLMSVSGLSIRFAVEFYR